MSGCGGNNAPPGYTANLLPLAPTWNYWPLGALPEKNSLKVFLNWPPTQGRQEMSCSHESEGNPE